MAGREKPGLPALSEEGCRAIYAEPLPTFRDVPAAEKQLLFVRKLHLCAYTFDFTDQARNVREKEIKRQTLLELVDYVNQGAGKFTESVAEDIVFMLSNNLFRALPPTKSHDQDNLDPDEEEPALEPAWPHLQVLSCALGHGAGVDVHCGCGIASALVIQFQDRRVLIPQNQQRDVNGCATSGWHLRKRVSGGLKPD